MDFESFRGAESKLFQKKWFNFDALYKVRFPKNYRIKELDAHFRKQRTIFEARLLARAKEANVRVPLIYEIDLVNATIVMEYIQGEILKTYIQKVNKTKRDEICFKIGKDIGLLHKKGIIHGDLTTSNIINIDNKDQIAFIDFGLGYISDKIEDCGIDLYLLERAIKNTHPNFADSIWEMILKGYKKISPNKNEIEHKLDEIYSRGRYSDRI